MGKGGNMYTVIVKTINGKALAIYQTEKVLKAWKIFRDLCVIYSGDVTQGYVITIAEDDNIIRRAMFSLS